MILYNLVAYATIFDKIAKYVLNFCIKSSGGSFIFSKKESRGAPLLSFLEHLIDLGQRLADEEVSALVARGAA